MINRKKAEKLCSFFAAPKDFLARRRSNTAPTQKPSINISDIETNGISLEQLDGLNVPVYRYTTQITIHGIWPDTSGYCLRYKHLTTNKNKSIGIRYGAIDGAKKKHLRSLCSYSRFSSHYSSSDNYFYMSFRKEHKSRALRVFNYLQGCKELFVGGVSAMYDPVFTGRYYVLVDLAAIPEANIELFEQKVLKVTPAKIKSVDLRRAEKQAKRQADDEARKTEHLDRVIETKSKAIENLLNAGYKALTPNGNDYKGFMPTYDTEYNKDYTAKTYYPAYRLIEVRRKSFGPCYKSITSTDIDKLKSHSFDWSKKSRRLQKPIETIYTN